MNPDKSTPEAESPIGNALESPSTKNSIDNDRKSLKRPRSEDNNNDDDMNQNYETDDKRTKIERDSTTTTNGNSNNKSITDHLTGKNTKPISFEAVVLETPTKSPGPSSSSEENLKPDDLSSSSDEQDVGSPTTPINDKDGKETAPRWKTHQMAEDYVDMVGKMMYPSTKLRPYGYDIKNREYPLERISVLGFLKSPLRRPTIVEMWSPYEIAVFEGAMLHYGKEFHLISKAIGTKATTEVIDFYYVWKKTAHYKKWKDQFISDEELIIMEEEQRNGF